MRGDFSRLTFRPGRHYSAVLLQQGRPVLDSDWNEEAAIASNATRALARDLLGPHAGVGEGFSILERSGARSDRWDFLIEPGVYYVDGIRCENVETVSYRRMAQELGCDDDRAVDPGDYLVFLDVWDRFLTATEQPELLEPALGGLDASTRLQVVWRVRLLRVQGSGSAPAEHVLAEAFARDAAGMRARVDPAGGYAGLEDHLYRVEVHASGGDSAGFKWSRDNGSVVAPVRRVEDDRLELASMPVGWPWDVGTWVEPEDGHSASCGYVPPLIRIEAVEGNILSTSPAWPLGSTTSEYRSIRRWDHGAAGDRSHGGAVPIREGQWLDLEDGIQVAFDPASDLRTGDYWLIRARTADGSVEWPSDTSGPSSLEPSGVDHHRAPLAKIEIRRDGSVRVAKDLRRVIRRLTASG